MSVSVGCDSSICLQLSMWAVLFCCLLPPWFPAAFSVRALYLLGTCYQVYEVSVSIKEITAWRLTGLLSLCNAPKQHSCRNRSLINPRAKVREQQEDESWNLTRISLSGYPQQHIFTSYMKKVQLIFWKADLCLPIKKKGTNQRSNLSSLVTQGQLA